VRRRALLAGSAAATCAGRPARAQRAARPFRIGYLGSGQAGESGLGQFKVGLGRIGWVEGRDYALRLRYAEFDTARLPALLGELLREGIDVLVTSGAATRMLPEAEKSVPVVFSYSGDPIAAGYVRSLARPGGNATGNSQLMWELVGKRLELLREIAPGARRTLVVQSPDHPGQAEERRRTLTAGERLGFEMVVRPTVDRASLEVALAGGDAAACDSLLCFTDAVTLANRHLIADHARRARIPAIYPRRDFCDAGGLASYGPNIAELNARLAVFVERIAGGARAGDIPVEWPTVIETVANRRTAEAIGFALPPTLLARADEVIE
jgi:putative ABC transport system substrate-binding protein